MRILNENQIIDIPEVWVWDEDDKIRVEGRKDVWGGAKADPADEEDFNIVTMDKTWFEPHSASEVAEYIKNKLCKDGYLNLNKDFPKDLKEV